MTRNIIVLLTCFFISSALNAQTNKPSNITITNKTVLSYTDNVIAIPWQKVIANYPSIDTCNFKIVDAVSKKETAYQLEFAGKSNV